MLSKWGDMNKQSLTQENKDDQNILKLKSMMDGKQFFKAEKSKQPMSFFQEGTVIEGASDFVGGRITKK